MKTTDTASRTELSFLHGLNSEDSFLAGSIADKIEAAVHKDRTAFTGFLSEGRAELAKTVAAAYSFGNLMLWGGYEGAERVMFGAFSDYEGPSAESFPIKALTFTFRKQDKLTHRDVLGSLMGLGLTRESVGDILMSDDSAVVFLTVIAAQTAERELAKIGRAGIGITEGFDPERLPKKEFAEIKGTVSSLRVDCVVALAIRCSRTKAEQLVTQGAVLIKGHEPNSGAKKLSEGDTFTVRGYGKFILGSIDGSSKKERVKITVRKFV